MYTSNVFISFPIITNYLIGWIASSFLYDSISTLMQEYSRRFAREYLQSSGGSQVLLKALPVP